MKKNHIKIIKPLKNFVKTKETGLGCVPSGEPPLVKN